MAGGNGETGENEDTNKEPEPPEEIIPETESYVGYYADMEGDGIVDGIIFADMAVGNTGSGQWSDSNGLYTIPVKDNLKEYTISKEKYNDDFGENYVITPKKGTTENERFYIMALDDIDGNTHYWYKSAFEKMTIDTSEDFEKGKENTQTMIAQWNSNKYQPQDDNDMWGLIQTQVNGGWFIPSKAEWSAFAEELNITKDNYKNYNLSEWYWCSSQNDKYGAWYAHFYGGYMSNYDVNFDHYVRMAAIF